MILVYFPVIHYLDMKTIISDLIFGKWSLKLFFSDSHSFILVHVIDTFSYGFRWWWWWYLDKKWYVITTILRLVFLLSGRWCLTTTFVYCWINNYLFFVSSSNMCILALLECFLFLLFVFTFRFVFFSCYTLLLSTSSSIVFFLLQSFSVSRVETNENADEKRNSCYV